MCMTLEVLWTDIYCGPENTYSEDTCDLLSLLLIIMATILSAILLKFFRICDS